MIERYTIASSTEELSERFKIEVDEYYLPSYNAAPTQKLPIIANAATGGLSYFYWGSNAAWSNNKSISAKLISAPIGDLFTKSLLKPILKSKRCLIPITGFYLWKQVGKKSHRPYYFTISQLPIFSLAGLWEEYDSLDGKINHTFKMISLPNDLKETGFGKNLPLILDPDSESKWLDTGFEYLSEDDILQSRLKTDFLYHIVAPHISNIKINSPKLIEPQPPIDQLGNFTLFE